MKHVNVKFNQEIEDRIADEIIVDAYGSAEVAAAWNAYLADMIRFPFKGWWRGIENVDLTPCNESVDVIDFLEVGHPRVKIIWNGKRLTVPLEEIEGVGLSADAAQAMHDWAYWIAQGYEF
jgi:hypothetical protein